MPDPNPEPAKPTAEPKASPPRRPLKPLPPDDPIYSSGAWILFPSAPQARPSGEQHLDDDEKADSADLSGS